MNKEGKMELIKWANDKGRKLILSEGEAEELIEALRQALRIGNGDCGRFEVEIES